MTTPHPNPTAQQSQSQSSPSGILPSSSTFSFKAPFPVSSPPSAAAVSALKHRRVSLASPSSPRLVQPWSFRDEMGLHVQPPAASSSPPTATAVPEKKGKIRKLDPKLDDPTAQQDKKPRKKWSNEETQMLVQGCQIHGVGNWKTILQDPDLKFHDRSAVDLKDRFRTYFPDAYQRHYPNARTHLSSKIRSTLADGTSLFEKTRSKRRRPFTDAEDRALKAGYEKHGTTWATIVKDPIFAEQNRRSTDLRDRFRNAFPDLYQAAGYKPRSASKKKLLLEGRAADDQLSTTAGPVRSRRRAKTSQGLLRGGTKSVPQSTVCSEDEESEEEESETSQLPVFVENVSTASYRSPTKKAQNTTTTTATTSTIATNSVPTLASTADTQIIDADDEMELLTLDSTDALNIPDFLPNNVHSDMETWSSGLNTPTHSSTAAWSTAAVSPSSSHISDLFMNAAVGTSTASSPFIQRRTSGGGYSINGNGNSIDNNFGMIGKSAWGTDWFSPNPRLDASSTSSHSNTSSSFMDPANFSPASPFSFQGHLNHGVLDRYDLFPPYMPDGNVSEAGLGDAFGDDDGMGCFGSVGGGSGGASGSGNATGAGAGASSGGTGFKGYHSQIAGDLISGDGARMHHHYNNHHNNHNHHHHHHNNQHNHQPTAFSLSSLYGTSFASGFGHSATAAADAGGTGATSSSSTGLALGLEGIPENVNVNVTSIHPMQLHSHASSSSSSLSLSLGVAELGATGVLVGENGEGVVGDGGGSSASRQDDDPMDEGEEGQQQSQSQVQENREDGGNIQGASSSSSSGAAAAGTLAGGRPDEQPDMDEEDSSLMPFGMEDLVDMNELHHATPPGTPLVTQPRPMRRSEGSWLGGFEGGFGFGGFGGGGGIGGFGAGGAGGGGNGGGANGGGAGGNGHARSISVPPSEAARNGHHHDVGVPMSVDDVGLHSMHLSLGYHGFGSGVGMGGLHSIFGSSATAASGSTEDQRFQLDERQSRTVDPQKLGVAHSPTSPSGFSHHRQQHHHQQHHHQQQHHHHQQETQLHADDDDDDDDHHQHTSELTPLFPANLILSPAGAVTSVSLPSSSSQGSEHANANGSSGGGSGHHTPVIDHRHTPVIDHRHTPVIEQRDELWRSAPSSSFSSFPAFSGDYNLPFLDLHYYGGGGGGGSSSSSMFGNNHNHGVNHNVNHHGQSHHPHHAQSHHLHPHPHHLHNTLGLDVSSMDDLYSTGMTMEATRQGQALDLAQTNAQMGSFGVGGNLNVNTTHPNPNSAPGGLGGFERTPSPSGTIRVHHHQQQQQHRRKPLLAETFSPPGDSRDAVDVVGANAKGNGNEDRRRRLSDSNSNGTSHNNNMSTSIGNSTNNSSGTSRSKSMTRSTSDDSRAGAGRGAARVRKLTTAGNKALTNIARTMPSTTTTTTTTTTTIPASTRATPTPTTTTIGRSMSHHRGQSAASAAASGSGVCPRDLMLRNGDTHKRKRASWDGGLG